MTMIRFSDALAAAQSWSHKHRDSLPSSIVLVRDLYGRFRVAIPSPEVLPVIPQDALNELNSKLGVYSPGIASLVLFGDRLVAPEAIFSAQDLFPLNEDKPEGPRFLDRLLTGADWLRPQFSDAEPCVPRVTFYGLKGGVGRSTALALFARYLAAKGKKVLVLDLDLESPGVGSLLLPAANYPLSGVVDWFVEDAVGQADLELVQSMTAISPLAMDLPGAIFVVPAHGADESAYIPKLSRVTLDVRRESKVEGFAQRLNRLVETLEAALKPDVVLLDSRAGLHDVAAIALTRLDATAFLFAANGAQTWQGYELLFRHWQNHYGILPPFRDQLRVVDALVPETGRAEHRSSAIAASYALFGSTIYEETAPGNEDAFNFGLDDPDAPHFSIPIMWSRVFQGFNPSVLPRAVSEAEVDASYSEFLRAAERLVFGVNES